MRHDFHFLGSFRSYAFLILGVIVATTFQPTDKNRSFASNPDFGDFISRGVTLDKSRSKGSRTNQSSSNRSKSGGFNSGGRSNSVYQPAHTEARIDQVFAMYNLNGSGTVFAMIDDGCDYRHPDFIDAQGNTRIAYLYDMLNPTGADAPNNPYGVGTIFTEADINASLLGGGAPIAEERHGHGTATTGIAVGNGSGNSDNRFAGVASEAKIIVIKAYTRSFPAHGTQPGQTGSFNPANLITALSFAADKIEELDMPGVAVINAGSLGGPADGTSSASQAMEMFIARGHTLVCGTGDEGGQDNHTSGNVALSQTKEIEIEKGDAGNLRFSLWYSEDDRFDVEIERPDGTTEGPFPSPPTENSFDDRGLGDMNYFHRAKNQEFFGATSNRRLLMIDIFGVTGTYKIKITASSIGLDGGYHAVLNPSFFYSNNRFLDPVAGYSMHDLASAPNLVCPGDYVDHNQWNDVDGIPRQVTGQGNPGEIWLGSSEGPTQDERQGIDFAAPGEMIWSPYYPNSWYSSFRFNMIETGNELYGRQSAVSAANPLVAGVVCLMLQANPEITPQQIKSIFRDTARQDSFTGAVPNQTWGNGKLDALAAVQAALELSYVVTADDQKLLTGVIINGSVLSTHESDNDYLQLDPAPTTNPFKQRVDLILLAESPSVDPAELGFRIEAKMVGGPVGDVLQSVEMFDQEADVWEPVDSRLASVADESTLIEPTGNINRFVHPVTGEVLVRVIWNSTSFQGAPFPWSIDFDQGILRIVQ